MKLLIDMNLSPRWTTFFAASHIEKGAIVTIDPRKARVTMLPL